MPSTSATASTTTTPADLQLSQELTCSSGGKRRSRITAAPVRDEAELMPGCQPTSSRPDPAAVGFGMILIRSAGSRSSLQLAPIAVLPAAERGMGDSLTMRVGLGYESCGNVRDGGDQDRRSGSRQRSLETSVADGLSRVGGGGVRGGSRAPCGDCGVRWRGSGPERWACARLGRRHRGKPPAATRPEPATESRTAAGRATLPRPAVVADVAAGRFGAGPRRCLRPADKIHPHDGPADTSDARRHDRPAPHRGAATPSRSDAARDGGISRSTATGTARAGPR
jgi:hypothetical protein